MSNRKKYDKHLVLKQLIYRFESHNISTFGTEIAYFLLMSIFPFIMFLMAILGFMKISVKETLLGIYNYMPYKESSLYFMENYLDYLFNQQHYFILFFSLIFTIWTASKGVNAIFNALDKAYDTASSRSYFKRRGIAYLYTVLLGIIIVIITTVPIFGEIVLSYLDQYQIKLNLLFWIIAKFKILLLGSIFLFVLISIYYIAPNKKLTLKSVLPGSIFTLIGWVILSFGYSIYVKFFTKYTIIYGSLGALILFMIWFWFLGIILVLGGEINAILWDYEKIKN